MKVNVSKINLTIGDYSSDGHGKKEDYLIESNITLAELKKAYAIGSEKVGFDLIDQIAAEYEDSSFPQKHLLKLKELGFDYDLFDEKYCRDDDLNLQDEEYVDIFLFICKLGNEEFKYEFLNDDSDNWDIGGYGLFY